MASQDYAFTLMSRNEIDQEIVVAQVLPFYQYMGGSVELRWSSNELDPIAEQVIQKMVSAGISRQDISRVKLADGRYVGLERGQLRIALKTAKTQITCKPFSLKTGFDEMGQESCAINDNLDMSLMRTR